MHLALLGLVAGFATAMAAQSTPEVVGYDNTEIQIQLGSRTWRVEISQLILQSDCEGEYLDDKPLCEGTARTPCPDCPQRFELLAWDLRNQMLYFALVTGHARNNPWAIFRYSLATRRTTRVLSTWSAAVGSATVSPSGRFVAWANLSHGGYCDNSDTIEIVDVRNGHAGAPPLGDEALTSIRHIAWLSNSVIEYAGDTQSEPECRDGKEPRPLKGRVNVSAAGFR